MGEKGIAAGDVVTIPVKSRPHQMKLEKGKEIYVTLW